MRRSIAWAVLVGGLAVSGCGSSIPTETVAAPSDSDASPSASEPSASPQGGAFVGGSLQAEQTGTASRSWDLQLVEDQSFIDGETTNLVFGSGSAAGLGETVAITIEGDEFTVIAEGGVAHFDGGTGNGCTFAAMPNHGAGIAGTFECKDLSALAGDESVIGPVDFSGSFSADQ